MWIFKGAMSRSNRLKSSAQIFQVHRLQSVSIFSIFNNPCSFMIYYYLKESVEFFYLSKLLFSGFLQFKHNFVRCQNNSKYCDWAPFISGPHARSITTINETVSSYLSGGFVANSLAIMNDALHQFFDLNSLLMSLVASWIARWKPNEKKTFGYYRAGKHDF